jgi:hypothetical protein
METFGQWQLVEFPFLSKLSRYVYQIRFRSREGQEQERGYDAYNL